jgi:hypothetical protein
LGKSDLKSLGKDCLSTYLYWTRFFFGNAVDGSTSFVAGENGPIDLDGDDSGEEAADDEDDQLTPLSIGTKRGSSTSTTASSPSKRSKSPTVRSYDTGMREHNDLSKDKISILENMLERRS